MHKTSARTLPSAGPRPRARTAEELLDQVEATARARLAGHAAAAGSDLSGLLGDGDVVRQHPRLAMATGALAGAAGALALLRALTSPVRSLRLARWLVPLVAGGRRPGRRADIARHLKAGLRLWARKTDAPGAGARP